MSFYRWLAAICLFVILAIPLSIYAVLSSETRSRWVIDTALPYSPVAISYTKFDGDLMGEFEFSDLTITTDATTVNLGQLNLGWNPWDFLQGTVDIATLQVADIEVEVATSEEVDNESPQPIELPEISLPVDIFIRDLRITNLTLADANSSSTLIDEFDAQLSFIADTLTVDAFTLKHSLYPATGDLQVTFAGNYPLRANVDWQIREPSNLALNGVTYLTGNLANLDLTTEVSSAAGELSLTAQLEQLLTGEPRWQADLVSNDLNPEAILELPENLRDFAINQLQIDAQGSFSEAAVSLTANGDVTSSHGFELAAESTINSSVLDLKKLQVTHIDDTTSGESQTIELVGTVTEWLSENPAITANLTWPEISYPLPFEQAQLPDRITSSDGRAQVDGTLNDYRIDVQHQLGLGEESLDHKLVAGGSTTHLTITQFDLQHASGLLSFIAEIDWAETLTAEVSELNADFEVLGEQVTANGQFSYDSEFIQLSDVILAWGDSRLETSGGIALDQQTPTNTRPSLEWQLTVPDISQLANLVNQPDITGAIEVSGQLSGTLERPEVSAELTGTELQAAAQKVNELAVAADYIMTADGYRINLNKLDVNHEVLGVWQLSDALQAEFKNSSRFPIALSDTCLVQQQQDVAACITFTREESLLTSTLEVEALPLTWVAQLLPDNPSRLAGILQINSELEWDEANNKLVAFDGKVFSDNARIVLIDKNSRTRFSNLELLWNATAENFESSLNVIPQDYDGELTGQLNIDDWLNQANLEGRLDADFNDLAILQFFLPQLNYENGKLTAALNIAGDREQPEFTGNFLLTAEQLGLTDSGILMTNARLEAADDAGNPERLNIKGEAQGGDGSINIEGYVLPLTPEFEFKIQGENFQALDSPEIMVRVSPDLTAVLKDNQLDITGEVTVPEALIKQPDIESKTMASNDVRVFENGEQVSLEEEATMMPMRARVRVNFGDSVRVQAFGFDGRLEGSIEVTDDGVRTPTATGNINVASGLYEIYGQELQIDRGALIYTGGVLENPGLDLRVKRTFSGTGLADDVEVGAQVGGTITVPNLRLFSTPAMPDSQILSYLVLGRAPGSENSSENMELQAALMVGSQGVDFIGKELKDIFAFDEVGIDSQSDVNDTSFFVGKYLSPRLYVKYGIGLLEPTSTFFVRYTLSDYWQLESTSSAEAQGGDVIYIIETD